jgi:hypothetical protein
MTVLRGLPFALPAFVAASMMAAPAAAQQQQAKPNIPFIMGDHHRLDAAQRDNRHYFVAVL